MRNTILYFSLILLFFGCNPDKKKDPELHHLAGLLTGYFSSKEQAEKEIGYIDTNLINTPIWKDQNGYWLYSEVHNAKDPSIIYTQRIFKIEKIDSVSFRTINYLIPDQKKYANGWRNENVFDQLTMNELELRDGCDVFYRKKTSSIYAGKTNNISCLSNRIKNVAYLVSNIVLSKDKISVWDRGYDINGKQVWGKIQGPYRYKRVSKDYIKSLF
ncbi:chromophore lyase CpcT/CpeT [Aquimarina sp. 2201CG5-10]|uniref:chromophore lyase CpcT/CpeT n=1 Tax=Aquimarina callyspongiae TaxID=3098150 RepID=UPI002AB5CE50|nr:chromophore lyase CpcT/CpeT [Aquimarina sp. 2201CG5-10]MDY8134387.1 chromophore lyase CpcT/CpeT [Aquimarina sp. 2201CG5-10]